MTEDIKFKLGERISDPRSMSKADRVQWKKMVAENARDYLFAIGQPLVYKRNGHVVAEHKDGRVLVIRSL